jgi:hypothetical protein
MSLDPTILIIVLLFSFFQYMLLMKYITQRNEYLRS